MKHRSKDKGRVDDLKKSTKNPQNPKRESRHFEIETTQAPTAVIARSNQRATPTQVNDRGGRDFNVPLAMDTPETAPVGEDVMGLPGTLETLSIFDGPEEDENFHRTPSVISLDNNLVGEAHSQINSCAVNDVRHVKAPEYLEVSWVETLADNTSVEMRSHYSFTCIRALRNLPREPIIHLFTPVLAPYANGTAARPLNRDSGGWSEGSNVPAGYPDSTRFQTKNCLIDEVKREPTNTNVPINLKQKSLSNPPIDPFEAFGRALSVYRNRVRHIPYIPKLGFTSMHEAFISEADAIITVTCSSDMAHCGTSSLVAESYSLQCNFAAHALDSMSRKIAHASNRFVLVNCGETSFVNDKFENVIEASKYDSEVAGKLARSIFENTWPIDRRGSHAWREPPASLLTENEDRNTSKASKPQNIPAMGRNSKQARKKPNATAGTKQIEQHYALSAALSRASFPPSAKDGEAHFIEGHDSTPTRFF